MRGHQIVNSTRRTALVLSDRKPCLDTLAGCIQVYVCTYINILYVNLNYIWNAIIKHIFVLKIIIHQSYDLPIPVFTKLFCLMPYIMNTCGIDVKDTRSGSKHYDSGCELRIMIPFSHKVLVGKKPLHL